jgi:hypothetical protein
MNSEWSRVVKGEANAESEASLDEPAERTTLGSRGNMGMKPDLLGEAPPSLEY